MKPKKMKSEIVDILSSDNIVYSCYANTKTFEKMC